MATRGHIGRGVPLLEARPFTRGVVAAGAVAGAYVGLWIALGRPEALAARDESHMLLDAAIGISAMLAAIVVVARMSRVIRLEDVLLGGGLAVLAASTLAWRVIAPPGDNMVFGTATATRLVGTLLVISAALVGHERIIATLQPPFARPVALLIAVVALIAGGCLLVDRAAMNAQGAREATWVGAALALVGTMAMLRKERRTADPLWGWLAIALVVLAASRLQIALSPAGHPGALGGDLLPLSAFVAVLAGAIAEIRTYWRARARDEAAAEARHFAERVHDGLVQDIVYARRTAADAVSDEVARARVTDALVRAEHEARELMDRVERGHPFAFPEALEYEALETGARVGIDVRTVIARDLHPTPETAEVLMHAVAEGVSNAARHSGAPVVVVEVYNRGSAIVLRVRDRGRGTARRDYGFGLRSVEQAATRAGGRLRTASSPGRGMTMLLEVEQ